MPGHPSNCSAEIHSPKNHVKIPEFNGSCQNSVLFSWFKYSSSGFFCSWEFFLSSNSGPIAKDMYQKVMIDVPQDLRQL